jgi:hypothetical protein
MRAQAAPRRGWLVQTGRNIRDRYKEINHIPPLADNRTGCGVRPRLGRKYHAQPTSG